jgi:hypothetical protein
MADNADNLFEGKPDARQGGADQPVSLFRTRYRALSPDEIAVHDMIKLKADELHRAMLFVAPGRYRSLAVTALETAVLWVVKGLTGDDGLAK